MFSSVIARFREKSWPKTDRIRYLMFFWKDNPFRDGVSLNTAAGLSSLFLLSGEGVPSGQNTEISPV